MSRLRSWWRLRHCRRGDHVFTANVSHLGVCRRCGVQR